LSFSFYVHLLYLSYAFSDFVIHLFGFLSFPRLFPAAFFSDIFKILPFSSSPHLFFSFTYVTITLLGFCFMLFLSSFHAPLNSLLFFQIILLLSVYLSCYNSHTPFLLSPRSYSPQSLSILHFSHLIPHARTHVHARARTHTDVIMHSASEKVNQT
jgi:hypothetical protein